MRAITKLAALPIALVLAGFTHGQALAAPSASTQTATYQAIDDYDVLNACDESWFGYGSGESDPQLADACWQLLDLMAGEVNGAYASDRTFAPITSSDVLYTCAPYWD